MATFAITTQTGDILMFGTQGHSGRYPLGSGERPYQDDRFTHMRKPGLFALKAKKAEYKAAKAEYDKNVAEAKRKAEEERLLKEKERIMRDGTANEINAISSRLSDSELNSALNRLRNRNSLAEMAEKENKINDAWHRIDKMADKMGTINKFTKNTYDGYTNYKNISKMLGELSGDIAAKAAKQAKEDNKKK